MDTRGNHIRPIWFNQQLRRLVAGEPLNPAPASLQPNCVNCTHFQASTELCAYNARRPPAHIMVAGCDYWEDFDDIPF